MEAEISKTLIDLGITPQLAGYHYLKDALLLVISDNTYLKNTTKRLYPEIAKKHSAVWGNVERAMRHAINKTGTGYTNAQFIGVFAEKLSLGQI